MQLSDMIHRKIGNQIVLKRNQWSGHEAYISDYPGLLEKIKEYTWTFRRGEHPYIWCVKLKVSLHKFILMFLYGDEKVNTMLENGNIIEHLDNNGLNCAYDNLHIVSSDLNKAKAFSIDKMQTTRQSIPSYVTDVYYSHNKQLY